MQNRASPGTKRGSSADPLKRAATVNLILESAEDFQQRQLANQQGGSTSNTDGTKCKVKNNSGANRRRGDILEFTGYALNDAHIPNSLWLTGGSPTLANGFGVLTKPIIDGAINDCQVAGACFAYVNVTDAGHKFAAVSSGNYVLQSAATGLIRILYKPSGTGEKEAIVLLGFGPELEIYLGKTDETASKHNSTTYTVSRYSDTSTDTGTNDEVLQLFATTVGSGKWCIYVKIGSSFYMIAAEC